MIRLDEDLACDACSENHGSMDNSSLNSDIENELQGPPHDLVTSGLGGRKQGAVETQVERWGRATISTRP